MSEEFDEVDKKRKWLQDNLNDALEEFTVIDYNKKLCQNAIKFFRRNLAALDKKDNVVISDEEEK